MTLSPRLAAIQAKADPRALARIEAFRALLRVHDMSRGFVIDAETIHTLFEIKEPYGLWRKRKLTHFKEFKDYARDGKTWLVTVDCAAVMALGNASKVGGLYSCMVSAAMCDFVEQPGNERLRDFRVMMEEAEKMGRENERLEGLFDE